ncbi:LysR family transcriptional regulator [Ottowia thiooxydans]|uniref:LysR family transcriptional regulator n=1 Tax=Ottowia thiooxydans TaxID=219182 RepID=UPI0006849E16|nr:LysR family transcriptional regulator [Ottowia thiooxydans]
MQVKIRQLRALDAAVRLGSFAEAARALHVTPAALSLAIRELEDILGFRVLERTTRRLRLTEPGRGYLAHAQRTLAALEEADRFASHVRANHEVVRVATTQTIIATLLTHVLPAVHERFERVRLQPVDVAAAGIAESLLDGQADIAIGVNLSKHESFETRPLFSSRWFAFMSPRHPLAHREQLSWADIANAPLFMTKSGNYLRICAALGKEVTLADVQEATTAIAGLAMASAGAGITVFPAYVLPLAHVLGVHGLPLDQPDLPHELEIAVRADSKPSSQVHAMRALVMEMIAAKCDHLR